MRNLYSSSESYQRGFGYKLMKDLIWAIILPVFVIGSILIGVVDWLQVSNLKSMRKAVTNLAKEYSEEQYGIWKQLTELQLEILSNRLNRKLTVHNDLMVDVISDMNARKRGISPFTKKERQLRNELSYISSEVINQRGVKLNYLTYLDKYGRVVLRSTNPRNFGEKLWKDNAKENVFKSLSKKTEKTKKSISSVEAFPSSFMKKEIDIRGNKKNSKAKTLFNKATARLAKKNVKIKKVLVLNIAIPIIDGRTRKYIGTVLAGRIINDNSSLLKVTYNQIVSNSWFNFSMSSENINVLGYANTPDEKAELGYVSQVKLGQDNITSREEISADSLTFLTAYGSIKNHKNKTVGKVRISTPYKNYSKPITEQKAFVSNLFWILPSAHLILIIIMIPIGFLWSRKHARKVTLAFKEVSDLIDRVLEGDFNARADISSEDELEEIGNKLNVLIERLSSLVRSKEEREAIQHALMEMLVVVSNAAKGDLTNRAEIVEGELGELATSFNSMIDNLSSLIMDIKKTVESVNKCSENISKSSQSVKQGVSVQTDRTQEVCLEINKLQKSTSQIASSTDKVTSMNSQVLNKARKGGEKVIETVNSAKSLQQSILKVEKKVLRMTESCDEITKITHFIQDISNQTSSLSLNIALETSKRDVYGQNFSGISDQIRHLSDRVSKSANQIEQLLVAVQTSIYEVGNDMKKTVQEVVKCADSSDNLALELASIIEAVSSSSRVIEKLSSAHKQQEHSTEVVRKSSQEVEKIAINAKEKAIQMSALVTSLSEFINKLDKEVHRFSLSSNTEQVDSMSQQNDTNDNLDDNQNHETSSDDHTEEKNITIIDDEIPKEKSADDPFDPVNLPEDKNYV